MKQIHKWTLAALAVAVVGFSQMQASAADTSKGPRIGSVPEVTASAPRQTASRCSTMALASVERTHDLDSKGHATITQPGFAYAGKNCVTRLQRDSGKQVSTVSSCPGMALADCNAR